MRINSVNSNQQSFGMALHVEPKRMHTKVLGEIFETLKSLQESASGVDAVVKVSKNRPDNIIVVVSKLNKTFWERIKHAFGMMPTGKASLADMQYHNSNGANFRVADILERAKLNYSFHPDIKGEKMAGKILEPGNGDSFMAAGYPSPRELQILAFERGKVSVH